jgi:hydroxymethylpyrimidine/phosphomethylpyrimidine kinase
MIIAAHESPVLASPNSKHPVAKHSVAEHFVAMTIAGSDPGGGAGIQADLKTFAALGVYGYSVITDVIAQNSSAVTRTDPVAPALVTQQIESLAAECIPHALKTGALGNAAIVKAVARAIVKLSLPAPVVDPVIVASSGSRLLDPAGERAIRDFLIPLARIVTPNIAEAEALTAIRIDTDAAIREAARRIVAMGARAVVIKGGHRKSADGKAIDVFYDGRHFIELKSDRIPGGGAHGTGCAFSAAIAAYLARGKNLEDAVRSAKRYVTKALKHRFKLGKGRALLDHFA